MSALPKAVQASIDRANKLVSDLYDADGKLKTGAPDPAAAAAPATPPVEPGTTPAAPDAAAAVPPTPATAPASTSAPATPLAGTDWEHRYKVLQGKYNAEVPRLNTQLQDLQRQITGLQGLLASTRAPAAPAAPAAPLVDEKEIKEFGPDLYDFVKRVARGETAALLPEIDRRVAPVVQKVDAAQAAAKTANQHAASQQRRAMFDLLQQQVPNWEQLDQDPGFLAWLDQVDPYGGRVRGELLREAESANDGPRVVAFFTGYLKENAIVAPNTPAPAAAEPAASQPTLDTLVAPGTPKAGAARAPDGSGKRVWTRAEIGKFYADAAAGKYRSTEGQKRHREIEAEIFLAQREGRVRAA